MSDSVVADETDAELRARHRFVLSEQERIQKKWRKMPTGGEKDRTSRFIGTLEFALLQIESKARDRGFELNHY